METETKWKIWWACLFIYLAAVLSIGAIFGNEDYEYEFNKCSNMESTEYKFNVDVQINVQYAQRCYSIQHFKYARIQIILGDMFIILLVGVLIGLPIFVPTAVHIDNCY